MSLSRRASVRKDWLELVRHAVESSGLYFLYQRIWLSSIESLRQRIPRRLWWVDADGHDIRIVKLPVAYRGREVAQ